MRRLLAAAAALLAAAPLAACNSILGIGDLHVAGGTDGATPDATSGDALPADTVVGTAMITHVLPDGTTTVVPQDLSQFTIAAYVVDGSTASGFTKVTGAGKADGTMAIVGVPPGANYYLELVDPSDSNLPHLFYTNHRQLDLGYEALGRVATPTTSNTPVTLQITNMTPWTDGDQLAAFSFAVGVQDNYYQLTNGDSNVSPTLDWNTSYGAAQASFFNGTGDLLGRLVATGDDFTVMHTHATTITDSFGQQVGEFAVSDAHTATDVDFADGAPSTVPVPFQAISGTKTEQFMVYPGNLRAQIDDGGRFNLEYIDCSIWASPGASYGLTIGVPVVDLSTQYDVTDVSVSTMPHGDPYPPTMPRLQSCITYHARSLKLPDGTKVPHGYSTLSSLRAPSSTVGPGTIFGTAKSLKVGGRPVAEGAAVAFDGTAPVPVTWSPVSQATRYALIVYQAGASTPAIVINTDQTSIDIPAEFLNHGDLYVVGLYAFLSTAGYTQGHLLRLGFPLEQSRIGSGLIRMSDQCGNGSVDSGEDCDTGGDSATCDADCTPPTCGDGHTNAAAGEACDGGGQDTGSCNADCTANLCGDGHLNPTTEQCDDGNTNPGDGCDSNCLTE